MSGPNFLALVKQLEALQAAGQWPGMLYEMTNLVITLLNDPKAKAVVFGSAELDKFCLAAGRLAAAQAGIQLPTEYNDKLAVHVLTETYYAQGGHTPALKDVIRARPDLTHVVLVTNLHGRTLPLDKFNEDMERPVQVAEAPPVAAHEKLIWLMAQLAALRPGLLTLFNHHFDAVAIAAALPEMARETAYFHHADHDMALGVYLPHALHVDCLNMSFHNCRHHLGVHNPVYWPLVAPDLGARQGHRFMADGTLVTGSHGSMVKFMSPGRYNYFDVVLRRLAEVPGRHVHVGPLPEEVLAHWRARIAEAGIAAERFVHQPPVPSLWAYLRECPIDLCISSFPIQGGKGLVETQGAGLPVLMQQSTLSQQHSSRDLVYPDALWWETPDDFIRALQGVTPALLEAQAGESRKFYEQWHHPRELAYALNNARRTAPVPPVRHMRRDTLALYLR